MRLDVLFTYTEEHSIIVTSILKCLIFILGKIKCFILAEILQKQ